MEGCMQKYEHKNDTIALNQLHVDGISLWDLLYALICIFANWDLFGMRKRPLNAPRTPLFDNLVSIRVLLSLFSAVYLTSTFLKAKPSQNPLWNVVKSCWDAVGRRVKVVIKVLKRLQLLNICFFFTSPALNSPTVATYCMLERRLLHSRMQATKWQKKNTIIPRKQCFFSRLTLKTHKYTCPILHTRILRHVDVRRTTNIVFVHIWRMQSKIHEAKRRNTSNYLPYAISDPSNPKLVTNRSSLCQIYFLQLMFLRVGLCR